MVIGETSWRTKGATGKELSLGLAPVPDEPADGPGRSAYLHVLARLQGLLGSSPVPMLVIAGACRGPAASRVAEGLEAAARTSGLRTMVAELKSMAPHPILTLKRPAGEPQPRTAIAVADATAGAALELSASGLPALVERWFAHIGGSLDLLLIEAPPLDFSLSGALLAKAGDGLVIAVEEGVTPGPALSQAADLARASGCQVLGLVMSGARRRMPAWLRRLFGVSPRRGRPASA
jgi:hypothetical protein